MKILIIPDQHGQSNGLKVAKEKINEVDFVVFLGDYFDSYFSAYRGMKAVENFTDICSFARNNKEKVKLVIGNHDEFSDGGDYEDYGFKYAVKDIYYKNIIFSHRPIDMSDKPGMLNIHGHKHHKDTEYHSMNGDANVNVYPSFVVSSSSVSTNISLISRVSSSI